MGDCIRLRDREAVTKLFTKLDPKFNARLGGYTRALKNGCRATDPAPLAIIEFVEHAEEAEA